MRGKYSISTGTASEGVPAAFAVVGNVIDEGYVFLDRPRPPPQVHLIFIVIAALGGGGGLSARFCIHGKKFLESESRIDLLKSQRSFDSFGQMRRERQGERERGT